MAYGDRWRLEPRPVHYTQYSDGTRLPSLEVDVYLTPAGSDVEEYYGYYEVHMHRVKHEARASLGLTSRLGPNAAK